MYSAEPKGRRENDRQQEPIDAARANVLAIALDALAGPRSNAARKADRGEQTRTTN